MIDEATLAFAEKIESLTREVEQLRAEKAEQEREWAALCAERERPLSARINLLQDENDKMRACLKYLDKHGGLGLHIHDRITKALTRTN